MQDDKENLLQAWERFFKPFPTPGKTHRGTVSAEELEESHDIRAELVKYDSYIGGIVVTMVKHNRRSSYPLRRDPQLRQRLSKLISQGSPIAVLWAQEYLNHLDVIEEVIVLAERVVPLLDQGEHRRPRKLSL